MPRRKMTKRKRPTRRLVKPRSLQVLRPHGFPNVLLNKLIYDAGSFQVTGASTNGYGEVVFKANNLYDPDYTNVGYNDSVPLFDDLSAIYGKWRVTACKVKMTVANSNSALCDVGMYIDDTSTAVFTSTPLSLQNAPRSRYRHVLVGPYQSGSDVKQLTAFFDLRKIVGKDVKYESNYEGTGNSAPATQLYIHIGGRNKLNLATGSLAFTCALEIEYYIQWSDLETANTAND